MTRALLILLGTTATMLGLVGLFVPLLPSTPFLLLATWAFARSSPRLHRALREHPRLGPPIRDWQEAGVVPVRAKVLAVAAMSASVAWMALGTDAPAVGVATVAALLAVVAIWLVTRPSRRPQ